MLAALAIVAGNDSLIKFNDYNPDVDLRRLCPKFQDCFNCTLANCEWAGEKGCTSEDGWEDPLTVQSFLSRGQKCGDPLDICSNDISQWYNEFTYQNLGFDSRNQETIIPPGYFCVHTFNNDNKLDLQLTIDHTEDLTGNDNEIVAFSKLTERRDGIYTHRTYMSEKDYAKGQTIYDGVIPMHSDLITYTSKVQVGYINVQSRRIPDADNFQVAIREV